MMKFSLNEPFDYEGVSPLNQLILDALLKYSTDIAINSAHGNLSYQELFAQINEFLKQLERGHIVAGQSVVIPAEKTPRAIAAMLACILRGVVFVFVNLNADPIERVKKINKEAKIVGCINLNEESAFDEPIDSNAFEYFTGDERLSPCCVFFTSGTTSTPKGILSSREALAHYAVSHKNILQITQKDRVAQCAQLTFDACLKDIVPTLLSGGVICLPTQNPYTDIPELIKWLNKSRVSVLQTVPSVLSTIEKFLKKESGNLNLLRLVVLAGESLSGKLLQNIQQHLAENCEIYNFYGPTETTILKAYSKVTNYDRVLCPVGKALPGTKIHVLMENGRLCPRGAVGHVVLHAPYPFLGYINADNQPFQSINGEDYPTLYFTGDQGRFEPDGQLLILGRKDNEVKIDGVRINPAEVAATLNLHPDISDSFILPYKLSSEQLVLVAYVILRKPIIEKEVREFLAEHLLESMIPGIFIEILHFPLTQNGKIDVAKLPPPERLIMKPEITPESDYEIKLMELWKDNLKIDIPFGVETHYYQLGGHSLKLLALAKTINDHFDITIDLPDLFSNLTIREQAKLLLEDKKVNDLEVSDNGIVPLSINQSRLYYLEKTNDSSTEYVMTTVLNVKGLFDIEKFQRCIDTIVENHRLLQSYIEEHNGIPHLIFHKGTKCVIKKLKTSRVLLEEAIDLEAKSVININQAPLMQVILLELSSIEHVILFKIHHIIGDAWSSNLLLLEWENLWNEGIVVEEKTDYFQYAMLQQSEAYQAMLKNNLDLWLRKLEASNFKAMLPKDQYVVPSNKKGSLYCFDFNSDLTQRIRYFCQQNHCSTYEFFMTVFSVFLLKLTGQHSFTIGTDHAGRNDTRFHNTLGFFVNTLVLPFHYSEHSSFLMCLEVVKKNISFCKVHGDVPYDQLVTKISDANGKISSLFQHMFRLWNFKNHFKLSDIEVSKLPRHISQSKFELTLTVYDDGHLLAGEFEYVDAFSKAKILEFSDKFIQLTSFFLDEPREILENSHKYMSGYTDFLRRFSIQQKCIVFPSLLDLLVKTTKTYSENVALVDQTRSFTYSELLKNITKISQELSKAGLKKGDVLAILGKKSVETYLLFLAGFYLKLVVVPIDLALPIKRIKLILAELPVAAVIYAGNGHELSELSVTLLVLRLTNDQIFVMQKPQQKKPLSQLPSDAVCVFFTSGTTGLPKGIIGKENSIAHFVQWQINEFKFDSTVRVAQLTSISFDAVLRDLFVPLLVGGCLCIPNETVLEDTERLLQWIESEEINVIHTVPSVASSFLLIDNSVSLKALKFLFLSGEALYGHLIRQFRQKFAHCSAEIVNFYGPSETTMIKSFHRTNNDCDLGIQSLGKPIEGADIVILDRSQQFIDTDEVGEIVIRTPYATLGYVNQSQNADKFVQNQYCEISEHLYRTGDLGRIDSKGNLHYLGRKDDQIKLRGIRIELGEVKTAILTLKEVEDCHILVDHEGTSIHLIAFVITTFSTEHLRTILEDILPKYAVPELVQVDYFPLLTNGKIDRSALIKLHNRVVDIDHNECSENEQFVKKIWEELLPNKIFDLADNFFNVGGHSLLATLLTTKIRQKFDIEFSLRELLVNPTIKAIAEKVEEKLKELVDV